MDEKLIRELLESIDLRLQKLTERMDNLDSRVSRLETTNSVTQLISSRKGLIDTDKRENLPKQSTGEKISEYSRDYRARPSCYR